MLLVFADSKVKQLYVYIYPLVFGFPSHIGRQGNLSRGFHAIE